MALSIPSREKFSSPNAFLNKLLYSGSFLILFSTPSRVSPISSSVTIGTIGCLCNSVITPSHINLSRNKAFCIGGVLRIPILPSTPTALWVRISVGSVKANFCWWHLEQEIVLSKLKRGSKKSFFPNSTPYLVG